MTTKYKIINVSGGPIGPIDICSIWGHNQNCTDPMPIIQDGEEVEFCGEGEPDEIVDNRLDAVLRTMGTHLGNGGVILDRADDPSLYANDDPDEEPPAPDPVTAPEDPEGI